MIQEMIALFVEAGVRSLFNVRTAWTSPREAVPIRDAIRRSRTWYRGENP